MNTQIVPPGAYHHQPSSHEFRHHRYPPFPLQKSPDKPSPEYNGQAGDNVAYWDTDQHEHDPLSRLNWQILFS